PIWPALDLLAKALPLWDLHGAEPPASLRSHDPHPLACLVGAALLRASFEQQVRFASAARHRNIGKIPPRSIKKPRLRSPALPTAAIGGRAPLSNGEKPAPWYG